MTSGIVDTLIGCVIIFGAMIAGLSPYASNILGYGVGFLLAYGLQKRWVFGYRGKNAGVLLKFMVSVVVSYAANFGKLHLTLDMGFHPHLAQIFGGICYAACSFFLSLVWVFGGQMKAKTR